MALGYLLDASRKQIESANRNSKEGYKRKGASILQ
jgi:hypothetical protein